MTGKDLFTKSDDELVAGKMIDVNFIYNFKINEQVTIGPVLGYMFQKFKHDVVGCKGYYWTTPVTCVNKTVLDFENDNNIPYLGVNSEVFFGEGDKSSISLSLLYSGWVSASYRDIHRYPDTDVPGTDIDKYSDGDHEGNAYIARLNMDWYFAENWFLGAGGEYLVMKTDGRQKTGMVPERSAYRGGINHTYRQHVRHYHAFRKSQARLRVLLSHGFHGVLEVFHEVLPVERPYDYPLFFLSSLSSTSAPG